MPKSVAVAPAPVEKAPVVAVSADRATKPIATVDQDRRAAEAASAAAVLAALVVSTDGTGVGDKARDGKPRTAVDLLEENRKSLAKLVSDSEGDEAKVKTTSKNEGSDDTRASDSKRTDKAYAAYAAYDADDKKAA